MFLMSEPRDAARSLCVRFFWRGQVWQPFTLHCQWIHHNITGEANNTQDDDERLETNTLHSNTMQATKKKKKKKSTRLNANDRTRACFQTETTTDVVVFHLKCNLHFMFLEHRLSGLHESELNCCFGGKTEEWLLAYAMWCVSAGSHSSIRKKQWKRDTVLVSFKDKQQNTFCAPLRIWSNNCDNATVSIGPGGFQQCSTLAFVKGQCSSIVFVFVKRSSDYVFHHSCCGGM